LLLLITDCSEGCNKSSLLSQKSKIGSKIESPPKTSHFFGIRKLPERWEKVGSDGQYFN